jgi:hypothetical protein
MAQEESPREDLLREATALLERIELVPTAHGKSPADACQDPPIVSGFRSNGALSIFFGDNEVYHFNAAGELRRSYLAGHLYKALNGELVSLARVRTSQQVELRSRTLDAEEEAKFISTMQKRLAALAASLTMQKFELLRAVPPDAKVADRLRDWLVRHSEIRIAARPNA